MAWFKREKKSIEQTTPPDERRVKTEGLWIKCSGCRTIVWKKDLEDNSKVCPKCQHHFRLNARQRLELLLDGSWIEHDAQLASNDPLHFVDTKPYAERLTEARRKLGMADAVLTAEGTLCGRTVLCCSMEFGFIGGSMGAVVGEKVTRAIERAVERKLPLVVVSCSGGARMMEGTLSLMQLAKVAAALARLDDAKLPYISVLTDPTTGGVTASYAMLGDLNIAEPGALIGFAGPRVIEQTIRQKLPEGFQRSEFLLSHGFLDAVVHRKDMKAYIANALDIFSPSGGGILRSGIIRDRMTYEESVHYLLTLGRELASPQQARAAKFDLENITALAASLGHPERAVPSVHVAGTNGKGSTAAMLASILRAAGLRAGLYTSPHLVRINERMALLDPASGDGDTSVSDADFALSFTRVHAAIEQLLASGGMAAHPTFFECVTAMAFELFARKKLDIAVYEVGLGGRLDSTNIIVPQVAVITPVDFDHEAFLGHSIEKIAGEKAGIIKPQAWVVSAVSNPAAQRIVRERAAEQNARLVEIDADYGVADVQEEDRGYRFTAVRPSPAAGEPVAGKPTIEVSLPLAGRFQVRNALAAIAAADLLVQRGVAIGDDAIVRGLATVRWRGRLERLQQHPDVFLDGTHNPAGARELVIFWKEHFAKRKIHLVYAAMRDKAVDEVAGLLFPRAATVIFTQSPQSRAISAGVLAEMTQHFANNWEIVPDPSAALRRAMELAAAEDVVFATGSLFLVGDLLRDWEARGTS